mgnify:CR=1 FL=1
MTQGVAMIKSGSDRQLSAVVSVLRQKLRAAGHSNRSAANALEVSEASVKRWLAGKGLTADRMEDLCQLAGMTLFELFGEAQPKAVDVATQLTLAQEKALAGDQSLSFTFFVALTGCSPRDIAVDFGLPDEFVESRLRKLERLALIDRLAGGKIRVLVDRKSAWLRGPLRTSFERYAKRTFVNMDFSSPHTVYAAEIVKLSPTGAAKMQELIHQMRLEVQALGDESRRESVMPGRWYWTLFATCDFNLSEVGELMSANKDR